MSNQWLRLWHDMPTDPKWRTIARASGQAIGNVIAVYVHMLVCASNANERGRTQSFNSEDVASALDIETEQVEQIVTAMQGRVLDGDMVKGWAVRQVSREDGSAERSKAWREAKKQAKQADLNDGERNRTQSERKQTPDTDTDTDKSKEVDKSTSKRALKKCPESFEIPEDQFAAITAECHLVDITAQTKIFRDYTFKSTKADWLATWRVWMRTQQERAVELVAKTQSLESFKQADARIGRERWEQMTGEKHPDNLSKSTSDILSVIDITPVKRIGASA